MKTWLTVAEGAELVSRDTIYTACERRARRTRRRTTGGRLKPEWIVPAGARGCGSVTERGPAHEGVS
jgi:hypothetical protein